MNNNGLEIERKFLIRFPDEKVLSAARMSEITQTYLIPQQEGWTERVRCRTEGGKSVYTHTQKYHLNSMRRIEDESEISEEEYLSLLQRKNPAKSAVNKKRYCYDYEGQMFEIDVYPFWNDRAVMELELEGEEQTISYPPMIEIIKEVTDDKRYTNSSIAKAIPDDAI